jgi:putative SOS response-associated peptidase YedK
MCGRYRLTAKERWLSNYFNIDPEDLDWAARWNVAPTQEVATIRQDRKLPKRRFSLMRWGLIPYWSKDSAFAASTINAASETVVDKPAFREPLRRRRCLIPADGFYEWKRVGPKQKQPYHIGMADDGVFAFAGLWDRWNGQDGKTIESCTILTTNANALLKPLHDRMPVILHPDDYDRWLDPGITDPERVTDLLRPFDGRLMRIYPVSETVNRADSEGPECAKEVAPATEQQSLFG